MVNPRVEAIRLNQNSDDIQIDVIMVGLTPGKPAEISGYITQSAKDVMVPFYAIKKVPDPDSNGASQVTLTVKAKGLTQGEQVTAVTRVAEVWLTVLDNNPAVPDGAKAAWMATNYTGTRTGYNTEPPPPDYPPPSDKGP